MDFQSYSQAADTKSIIWNSNLQSQEPYIIRGQIYPDTIPVFSASVAAPGQITIPTDTGSGLVFSAQTVSIPNNGSKSVSGSLLIPVIGSLAGVPIGDVCPIYLTFSGTIGLGAGGSSVTYTVYLDAYGKSFEIIPSTQVSAWSTKTIDLSSIGTVTIDPLRESGDNLILDLRIVQTSIQSSNVTLSDISATAVYPTITTPYTGVKTVDLFGHLYNLVTAAATAAATQAATEAATQAATEAATQAATEAATQAATEAATQAATEAATQAATEPETTTTTTTTEGSNM